MPKPKIIVISAPSGGGKTTLIRALLQNRPNLYSVITHTTRSMREGEKHEQHYHFVNQMTFEKMIHNQEFVEWAKIYDQYYGTSRQEVEQALARGKTPVINLDWQGAQNLRALYSPEQLLTIFILPPDLETLKARLTARGDSPQQIEKRLASAEAEVAYSKEYNHQIINDNFEHALAQLQAIIA